MGRPIFCVLAIVLALGLVFLLPTEVILSTGLTIHRVVSAQNKYYFCTQCQGVLLNNVHWLGGERPP